MGAPVIASSWVDAWRREAPAPVINHARFGSMRAAFRPESHAFIWECLDLVPTARGAADLEFEAGARGPTAAQERQLETILADLDALTEAAAAAIARSLGIGVEGSLDDPTSGLEWQGARLTACTGTFQLNFWRKGDPELLVTVSFEHSQPTSTDIHE